MKYAIITAIDGNFVVAEEGFADNPDGAKKKWHKKCEDLYAASDFSVARVKLVDENLDGVEGSKYNELIDKRPKPEPEPVEE